MIDATETRYTFTTRAAAWDFMRSLEGSATLAGYPQQDEGGAWVVRTIPA